MKDQQLPLFVTKAFGLAVPKNTGKKCAGCGELTASISYRKVVKPTLKEQAWFNPCFDFCPACQFVFHDQFRTGNWIITQDKQLKLKHDQIWDILLKELSTPYIMCFTTTYKKHNLIYSMLNCVETTARLVTLDQVVVEYDIDRDAVFFNTASRLYNDFQQTKKSISTGEYNVSKMDRETYLLLRQLDEIMRPIRSTRLLTLITTYVKKEGKCKTTKN